MGETLANYVQRCLDEKKIGEQFPSWIQLPDEVLKIFEVLWKLTVRTGNEYGCPLYYTQKQWIQGKVTSGQGDSVNIDTTSGKGYFGNVHTHPAEKVGGVSFYLPHSMQDLMANDAEGKRLFIRFVIAGPDIYAVVYRHGISQYNQTVTTEASKLGDQITVKQRAMLHKTAGGGEQYISKISTVSDPDAYIEGLKTRTTNFGRSFVERSWLAVARFAQSFHYGFYKGSRTGWYSGGCLYLQGESWRDRFWRVTSD